MSNVKPHGSCVCNAKVGATFTSRNRVPGQHRSLASVVLAEQMQNTRGCLAGHHVQAAPLYGFHRLGQLSTLVLRYAPSPNPQSSRHPQASFACLRLRLTSTLDAAKPFAYAALSSCLRRCTGTFVRRLRISASARLLERRAAFRSRIAVLRHGQAHGRGYAGGMG